MIGLAGKRVLFIATGFYDYEASIVERLRHHGAEVRAFFDRPRSLREGSLAALLRRADVRGIAMIRRHERAILRQLRDWPCDFVLVIKGIDLRPQFLGALRRSQGEAQFILYEWDSIARLPGLEERLPYFDRVLTFDRRDSIEHPNFRFRPLFFREGNPDVTAHKPRAGQNPGSPIHLCFVGWLHSDRLPLLRRLQTLARAEELDFVVYLYTGLYSWVRLALAANAANVHVRPLPYTEVMRLNRRAAVIVDLPSGHQSGLTMRAIEAVGLGKKLITTATDVKSYDFYSPERVQILDPRHLRLDRGFIEAQVTPLAASVRCVYSLDAWLLDVFQQPAVSHARAIEAVVP